MVDDSSTHRGYRFSISELDSAKWRWTLHPENRDHATEALYGEVSGTRDDAIKAAKAAIERHMK